MKEPGTAITTGEVGVRVDREEEGEDVATSQTWREERRWPYWGRRGNVVSTHKYSEMRFKMLWR